MPIDNDGAAALPTFSFLSETSLGLFRSGASTAQLSYGTLAMAATGRVVSNAFFSTPGTPVLDLNGGDTSSAGSGVIRVNRSTPAINNALEFYNGTGTLGASVTSTFLSAWSFGSSNAPGMRFQDEATLGWYRSATSVIALSRGGLGVKVGTNASCGTAVLVSGATIVNTTYVRTGDIIMLSDQGGGANLGSQEVNGITSSVSFAILSSNVGDTSTVAWWIIRPV